uniref:Uncharacterized protein n=1 Tax=Loa loa TaxID=7209 RepID=A0A1I7VWB3_LOALO
MAANGVHKSDDCLEEKGEEEEERGREVRSSSSSSSELGNTYSLSLNNKILCHIFGTVAGSHSLFTETISYIELKLEREWYCKATDEKERPNAEVIQKVLRHELLVEDNKLAMVPSEIDK